LSYSSHSPKSGPSSDKANGPWAVELEGVAFSYPDGTAALRGVDLRVAPGERLGIIGPNGAGKTTLLLHLNGILRGAGSVRIFGRQVSSDTVRHIRRDVGLVFQDPDDQLFLPRVFDDVAFGPLSLGLPRDEVETRVLDSLRSVEMENAVSRSTLRLSEGEKKRVAIAAVLACGPSILVFDEPTAHLDPRQRRTLLAWVKASAATRILASHDLEFILEAAERVVVLGEGRVVAEGPAERILGDATLMERCGLETPGSLRLTKGGAA
jgi:cobalt/nickel transport system ATP-binding protein